jgi:hypothetical protein
LCSLWLNISPKKQQHVAGLLPFLLPAKSLCHNVVADVADFPDLCVHLAETRHDHWLVARPSVAFVPSVPSYHFAVMGSKRVKIRKCLVYNYLGQKRRNFDCFFCAIFPLTTFFFN